MKTTLIATAAAALTLGSGVALAQTAPERGAAVTQDQMLTRAAARFDRRDSNKDGVLNEADRSGRADRAFAAMDADSDGMISRAEWDERRTTRMDRREARAERRGRVGVDRGANRMERRMARIDSNGDGAVTRDEALAKATERFARIDANRDGTVSTDERQAARAARQAAR